jgi:quinol monooxygenase YgiN
MVNGSANGQPFAKCEELAIAPVIIGGIVSRYGLFGKLIAQPGQRDALAAVLLEAAAGMRDLPGCEVYIVGVSESEPDTLWVSEVWSSHEEHEASLTHDETRAAIARGRPLIAGIGERFEYTPLGGKGLPAE